MSNPQRRCLGCNQSFDKSSLIRIVKTSDDKCVIDEKHVFNGVGKGGYLCASSDCLKKAVKKKAFFRCFKIDDATELIDALKNELKK
jgi:predicted RNA-binding protein YlxR (DUF448 family)